MTTRERFWETMSYGTPDRVPYFEEGIRKEVLKVWHKQGLPRRARLSDMFPTDRFEQIELDLDPRPDFRVWPKSRAGLDELRSRLDPNDPRRFPKHWHKKLQCWRESDHVLILRVHRGFFLSMGVHDWRRLTELLYLVMDDPHFVGQAMMIQGEFAAKLAEKVLRELEIDAALFSEPIGGNEGPLVSPRTYEELVLASYEPLLEVLSENGVITIILRTYANARDLIPSILKFGFNCLWACETNIQAMDYRHLRREFGRDLCLIGGIDLDVLRQDKEAIRREVEEKVPELIAGGGYIPLADGRIRSDVPYENYLFYRRTLEETTQM